MHLPKIARLNLTGAARKEYAVEHAKDLGRQIRMTKEALGGEELKHHTDIKEGRKPDPRNPGLHTHYMGLVDKVVRNNRRLTPSNMRRVIEHEQQQRGEKFSMESLIELYFSVLPKEK